MEAKVAKLMKKWGCTEQEAREMIAWDAQTDKMSSKQIADEMTPEQKKASKQARITTSEKKHSERKVERKPNEDKRTIIQKIFEAILGLDPEAKIINVERQIDFRIGSTDYSITLTAHRKAK